MRSWVAIAVLFAAVIGTTGCGPTPAPPNSGPKIEVNPKGPGAMTPPGEGGKPSLPKSVTKP